MIKDTPYQRIKKEFETKANLVSKLKDKLEKFEDEGNSEFSSRLMQVSNRKLLRLFDVHTRLEADFGSKDKLVDMIIQHKNPKQASDRPFKEKLLSYRVTRLIDMHDSLKKRANN